MFCAMKYKPEDAIRATAETTDLPAKLGTTEHGLNESRVDQSRDQYGDDQAGHGKRKSLFRRLCEARATDTDDHAPRK